MFLPFLAEEKEAEAREIVLNKHIIRSVGEKVGGNWKRLATELQFPEDDIGYFESEGGSPAEMAVKVLTIWMVSGLLDSSEQKNRLQVSRIFSSEFR